MTVCLACYQNRLASLYENAGDFLLYSMEDGKPVRKGLLFLAGAGPRERISALAAHDVTLLICGGICGRELRRLSEAGLKVQPWICGHADAVVQAWAEGRVHELTMPGCRRRCGKRRQGDRQ